MPCRVGACGGGRGCVVTLDGLPLALNSSHVVDDAGLHVLREVMVGPVWDTGLAATLQSVSEDEAALLPAPPASQGTAREAPLVVIRRKVEFAVRGRLEEEPRSGPRGAGGRACSGDVGGPPAQPPPGVWSLATERLTFHVAGGRTRSALELRVTAPALVLSDTVVPVTVKVLETCTERRSEALLFRIPHCGTLKSAGKLMPSSVGGWVRLLGQRAEPKSTEPPVPLGAAPLVNGAAVVRVGAAAVADVAEIVAVAAVDVSRPRRCGRRVNRHGLAWPSWGALRAPATHIEVAATGTGAVLSLLPGRSIEDAPAAAAISPEVFVLHPQVHPEAVAQSGHVIFPHGGAMVRDRRWEGAGVCDSAPHRTLCMPIFLPPSPPFFPCPSCLWPGRDWTHRRGHGSSHHRGGAAAA